MINLSATSSIIAALWFLSVFLFWAEYRKIWVIHNFLYSSSLRILIIRDKLSATGLFFLTEHFSIHSLQYIFSAGTRLYRTYFRSLLISAVVLLGITFIMISVLYIIAIRSSDEDMNPDNLVISADLKHELLKKVETCFAEPAPDTAECKTLTNLKSVERSFEKTDQYGHLIKFVKSNPVEYYSFWIDVFNNFPKHIYQQQGGENVYKFYFIVEASKLISSGIFYTISGSMLLFISTLITFTLINAAMRLIPRSVFAHIFAPVIIVIIDGIIAIICFIAFIIIVYFISPYLYYCVHIFEQAIVEIGEIFFFKPFDLIAMFRDSLEAAAHSNPTVPPELIGMLRIDDNESFAIDPASTIWLGSFFPSLSSPLESSYLQKLFYLNEPLSGTLSALFADLWVDIKKLYYLEWHEIHDQNTLRNYFLIIPMLPIFLHALVYTFLTGFLLFYYTAFIPVSEICSAAISRGPTVVYATVLMALFGLIAYLFPVLS